MNAKENDLLIGWASRDATPYGKKVDLAGQFYMRITEEVNDPVMVTALAMSSDASLENAVVFVSCDTSAIPAYLLDECGIKIRGMSEDFPLDALILNATHTHAAPATRDGLHDHEKLSTETRKNLLTNAEYRDFLAKKIAEAAIESWNVRKKGMIAWGLGYAVVGRNRRIAYMKDFEQQNYPGQKIERNVRMYGDSNDPDFSHVEGYEDHSVQFLFTFDADKRLTGAVVNIPCPAQVTESRKKISADFWHDAREEIRRQYGEELFILPQCSAAGDQSPHILVKKSAEARMLAFKEGVSVDDLDFDMAQRREIGRRIKTAWDDAIQWASKDIRSQAELKRISRKIDISRRIVTDFEYEQNLEWIEELKSVKSSTVDMRILRCEDIVKKYHEQKNTPVFPVWIHVVKLGDIAFAANPFELYLDYGLKMQILSKAEQTFVIQLAGSKIGPEWAGNNPARFPNRGGSYLASRRAESGGGYGATVYCNQIGSKGGEELVAETICELENLFS